MDAQAQHLPLVDLLDTRIRFPLAESIETGKCELRRLYEIHGGRNLGRIEFAERYRLHEDWERDDLISNMVGALTDADRKVSDKMVELCTNCDADWGRRLAEGLQAARAGKQAEGGNQYNQGKTSAAVEEAEEMAHDAKPY